MLILSDIVPSTFYDEDYYERGTETGKSLLNDYHYMPDRSHKEAQAVIKMLMLDSRSNVLDFGCAKGFFVQAIREYGIACDGCDISDYALSFAPVGCWDAKPDDNWKIHAGQYTHIYIRDVLEHMTPPQLCDTLNRLKTLAKRIFTIIPLGENGKYIVPDYGLDKSHLIAENADWWISTFDKCGWKYKQFSYRVFGIKDNWSHYPKGNGFYILKAND
jgi:SAM-dependent methyltransferase